MGHAGALIMRRAQVRAAEVRPVRSLHVLDDVDAAVLQEGPQDAERLDLVGIEVAAVVDDEIEGTGFAAEALEGLAVDLRALEHLDPAPGEGGRVVDVDAVNPSLGEESRPHQERFPSERTP